MNAQDKKMKAKHEARKARAQAEAAGPALYSEPGYMVGPQAEDAGDLMDEIRDARWELHCEAEALKEMSDCIFKETCIRILTAYSLKGLALGESLADKVPAADLRKACLSLAEYPFAESISRLQTRLNELEAKERSERPTPAE